MLEVLPKDTKEREKDILWLFDLALILKAINGGLEIVGAFLILFISPALILKVVVFITGGELAQDPDDPVATALRSAAYAFTVQGHYFLAAYLFVHGAVKLILVLGIFSGKKIAYPLFMVALAIFGAYELYRGSVRHEFLLLALAVFDFALLLLTAHEYRRRYPEEFYLPDTQGDYGARQ